MTGWGSRNRQLTEAEVQEAKGRTGMKTFEYMTVEKMPTGRDDDKGWNALGSVGWELVAVNPIGNKLTGSVFYLFKRELPA